MPTGATSDLLPVRKDTKERLARLKGSATYDALLRALLEMVPPERLEAWQDAQAGTTRRAVEARERPPEKQLLIADLAERRWKQWLDEGRAVQLGPRLYAWRPRPPTRRKVKYEFPRRRGLSP